jgi:hypothetical protein
MRMTSDIVTRLRQTRADMIGTDDEPHYWDCHDAAGEIERLRDAIRRLAEQDATLSVCDGAVTVTMDGALTDEELKAIRRATAVAREMHDSRLEAALGNLLERLG